MVEIGVLSVIVSHADVGKQAARSEPQDVDQKGGEESGGYRNCESNLTGSDDPPSATID